MDCIGCLFTRQRLNKIGDFPYFAFGCNCLFFYPLEKPPFPVWINYIRQKAKRAVVSCNLTGVSPRPMLMGAPRNTLRVFNAGVSLCRLVCRRPQAAKLVLRRGSSRSTFPQREKRSWRTRRPARYRRNVPVACYAAHQRPLSLSRNNRLCRPVTVHRFRCAVTERQIAHNGKRGKGTRSPHGLKDYPT